MMKLRPTRFLRCFCVAVLLLTATTVHAQKPQAELQRVLLPWAEILAGANTSFEVKADLSFPVSSKEQAVQLRMNRAGNEGFDLEITHEDYAIELRRRPSAFIVVLPKHNTVYLGEGTIDGPETLDPDQFWKLIGGPGTQLANYVPLITPKNAAALVGLAVSLSKLKYDAESDAYRAGSKTTLKLSPSQNSLSIQAGEVRAELTYGPHQPLRPADDFGGMTVKKISRAELETQFARGCRRGMELILPSANLVNPPQIPKSVPNGELRWVDGQRLVLLSGTPEEIGTAHAELLREESFRCLDSVLNVFGTLQMVRSGRWFREDLRDAAVRLLPHIPEDHRRETRAMASALGLDPQFVEELNVFPELFHCSGFAVFGNATQGGKLYHGRVLDYMTLIGLQDCATTFIIAPKGKIPFANIGYAAFIGSVSGMNAQTISLGEMGGRGEGNWDGVPMATLMRRALEECSTLDEVMALWTRSPRTCEYYYVFAEGKSRRAVGVAATPESIEFVHPGDEHPRLGPGIPDAVILSAGDRLQALRGRVQEKYGSIDTDVAQWLMCRPVAMKSNLHNVLFIPEDGIFYVANADHKRPAAERPYVEYRLNDLLKELPK